MAQLTWRTSDEILERVRSAARRSGRSMNDFVTTVLTAATNPDYFSDEVERVRERLARAGLLAPDEEPVTRPPADVVAAARTEAGKGTSLVDLVIEGRR